jgi:ABC-2 type transport system permease protein
MSVMAALLRRELGAVFGTPLGYAILTAFLLVQGFLFWTLLGALNSPEAPHGAALRLLFGGNLYFWIAQLVLVPLLTMRTIAEERRQGTLEVLLTAPVSAAQVVLAKFLGAYLFYLFLWVPTLAYVALVAAHAPLDPGPVFSGYLGVAVVGAALVAVGLLISALSPGPVAAASFSFAALGILVGIGLLSPHWPGAADLLDHFSLPGAMAEFGSGIVDLRRCGYPLSLAALSLFLAARALEARRLR